MERANVRDDFRLLRSAGTHRAARFAIRRAFVQQHDAVAEVERFVQIVGYQQHGFLQPLQQAAQHVLHFRAGERIERAEGLIHQQDCGIGSQRARQAYPLPLPSGKLMRMPVRNAVGLEAQRLRAVPGCAGRAPSREPSLGLRHQAHVALHREVRKEAGFLDHVAHAAAQCDEIRLAHIAAVDQHCAGRRLDHAIDGAQQRGFARAAAA